MLFRSSTYANVASTLALVVALGGTSYAAVAVTKNSVGSPQIINSSIKSADVKNGALKAADFKAGELKAGPQGPAGPAGATGPAGPAGAAGTARAYAYVDPAGPTLTRAKGFTAVRRAATGYYCLTLPGVDLAQYPGFATVDYRNTSDPEGNATAMWDASACTAGEVGVDTQRIPNPYGPATESNTVAFSVLIP